jgi:VWFA-related protein
MRTGRSTVAISVGALCLAALCPVTAAQQVQQPPTVRPSPAEVVMVDVVVVDNDGKPVTDLQRDDFVLRDEGREQPITEFERLRIENFEGRAAARSPVSTNVGPVTAPSGAILALVFDEQNLRPETLGDARKAMLGLLDRSAAARGELLLVGSGSRAFVRAREQVGLDALRAQVSKLKALHVRTADEDVVSEAEAMRIAMFDERATVDRVAARLEATERTQGGLITSRNPWTREEKARAYPIQARSLAQRVWLEARSRALATLSVVEELTRMLSARGGRKSVVLLSEGFVLDGRSPEWQRTLDAARRAHVVVYGVDVRGLRQPDSLSIANGRSATGEKRGESALLDQEAAEGSDTLATETGGFTRRYTNDLAAALERIASESRNYYLLGFAPAAPPDGKFHALSVGVRRPSVTVRARKGYLALASSETVTASRPIPLRLAAFPLEQRGDAVRVQVLGEVDPAAVQFEEHDGRRAASIDWLIDIGRTDRKGTDAPHRLQLSVPSETWTSLCANWVPVGAEFDLPPGVHVARLFVRDGGGGRVGKVEHVFEVPSPHSPYVSAVLSDLARVEHGAAPVITAIARRTFTTGAQLAYQFEVRSSAVESAAGPLLAGYELTAADGVVVMREEERPLAKAPDGDPARLIRISLEKAPAGRYELSLHVHGAGGGARLDWVESFEVVTAAPPLP